MTEDTYLEPDIVLFDRQQGLGKLAADTVLLVEIANSSLRYDTGRKAVLYAGFGVRELWLVDAVRLEAHVFRQPAADGYREVREAAASETIVPLLAPEVFALAIADLGIEG